MRRFAHLVFVPLLGCSAGGASSASSGELVVQWTDSVPGDFRAPATALWCARDSLLELFAVRNDTAVGFALLPKDSLRAGTYSVFPIQVFGSFRPQAGAAVRWLDEVELKGFEGGSGVVTVSEAGASGLSGTFEVTVRRIGLPDTLRITGRFARVPVGQAIEQCGRANRSGAG